METVEGEEKVWASPKKAVYMDCQFAATPLTMQEAGRARRNKTQFPNPEG